LNLFLKPVMCEAIHKSLSGYREFHAVPLDHLQSAEKEKARSPNLVYAAAMRLRSSSYLSENADRIERVALAVVLLLMCDYIPKLT